MRRMGQKPVLHADACMLANATHASTPFCHLTLHPPHLFVPVPEFGHVWGDGGDVDERRLPRACRRERRHEPTSTTHLFPRAGPPGSPGVPASILDDPPTSANAAVCSRLQVVLCYHRFRKQGVSFGVAGGGTGNYWSFGFGGVLGRSLIDGCASGNLLCLP